MASTLGSSGAKSGSDGSEASTECISPVTSPSRRSRVRNSSGADCSSSSASSQPSSASGTYCCRIPSVASTGRPEYAYQPCRAAMLAKPLSGEEAQELELRVDPGLEPAVRLQDQLVAEDDGRVRLLDARRPHLELAAERGRVDRLERDGALDRVRRRAAAHQREQLARERRVVERVVDPPAVDLPDRLADRLVVAPAAARRAAGRGRASPRGSGPPRPRRRAAAPRSARARRPRRGRGRSPGSSSRTSGVRG